MTQEKTEEKEEKTTKETKEVPKKFEKLIAEIEEMSALELSELVKVLEGHFGVSAAAPVAVAMAAPGTVQPVEEKTSFTVELTNAGSQRIAVIKAVRAVTSLGLKDAKDLVEKTPATIKENVPKAEAEEIKKQIEVAGGKVELK